MLGNRSFIKNLETMEFLNQHSLGLGWLWLRGYLYSDRSSRSQRRGIHVSKHVLKRKLAELNVYSVIRSRQQPSDPIRNLNSKRSSDCNAKIAFFFLYLVGF